METQLTASSPREISVLIVEDSESDANLIIDTLSQSQKPRFLPWHERNLAGALHAVESLQFDAMLVDLGLPDASGVKSVEMLCSKAPDIPAVVITGNDDDEIAIEAVRAGAQDFLVKQFPFPSHHRLVRTVRHAIARSRAHRKSFPTLPRIAPDPNDASGKDLLHRLAQQQHRIELSAERARIISAENATPIQDDVVRDLLNVEMGTLIDELVAHFELEQEYCTAKFPAASAALRSAVENILSEHSQIRAEFESLRVHVRHEPLSFVRTRLLSSLCRLMEHEISEAVLFKKFSEAN